VLQKTLTDYRVKKVADFGCGDWQFSQMIDWRGVEYCGFDIVSEVIEENKKRFKKRGISFATLDFESFDPIPTADLYIIKDVLQHWPTASIIAFLKRMGNRRMLITNTIDMLDAEVKNCNSDVGYGFFRPLDLCSEPFNLRRIRNMLIYDATKFDRKQVLMVNPTACP
jgi:2-polyprenyl-3-methyl-5-hydroxy-6-metoxy-1,4-benzoquinol methylase